MPGPLPPSAVPGLPLLALAPMQNVTDLAFMRVIAHYGAPDYFFTEYFRVHAQSRLEKHILRSIDENETPEARLRTAHRARSRAPGEERTRAARAPDSRRRPQPRLSSAVHLQTERRRWSIAGSGSSERDPRGASGRLPGSSRSR